MIPCSSTMPASAKVARRPPKDTDREISVGNFERDGSKGAGKTKHQLPRSSYGARGLDPGQHSYLGKRDFKPVFAPLLRFTAPMERV